HIQIGDSTFDFLGKGARKMAIFKELPEWSSRVRDAVDKEIVAPAFSNKELTYVYHYFERSNQLSKLWMKRIADERNRFSDAEYQLLLADGVSYIQNSPIFAVEVKALINKLFSSDEIDLIINLMDQKIVDMRNCVTESILARSDNW